MVWPWPSIAPVKAGAPSTGVKPAPAFQERGGAGVDVAAECVDARQIVLDVLQVVDGVDQHIGL